MPAFAEATPESDFWCWFVQNQASLYDFEKNQEATFDRLASEMHKVDQTLTFEFGPKENGRRDFVISADGIKDAFPAVEKLFNAAPALEHWNIIKFRPRHEPMNITYNGIKIKADSVTVVLSAAGDKVDIGVIIPGYTDEARKAYLGIAFLLLDGALGEYDVEMRVGRVDVGKPSPNLPGSVPLRELPKRFDAFFVKH